MSSKRLLQIETKTQGGGGTTGSGRDPSTPITPVSPHLPFAFGLSTSGTGSAMGALAEASNTQLRRRRSMSFGGRGSDFGLGSSMDTSPDKVKIKRTSSDFGEERKSKKLRPSVGKTMLSDVNTGDLCFPISNIYLTKEEIEEGKEGEVWEWDKHLLNKDVKIPNNPPIVTSFPRYILTPPVCADSKALLIPFTFQRDYIFPLEDERKTITLGEPHPLTKLRDVKCNLNATEFIFCQHLIQLMEMLLEPSAEEKSKGNTTTKLISSLIEGVKGEQIFIEPKSLDQYLKLDLQLESLTKEQTSANPVRIDQIFLESEIIRDQMAQYKIHDKMLKFSEFMSQKTCYTIWNTTETREKQTVPVKVANGYLGKGEMFERVKPQIDAGKLVCYEMAIKPQVLAKGKRIYLMPLKYLPTCLDNIVKLINTDDDKKQKPSLVFKQAKYIVMFDKFKNGALHRSRNWNNNRNENSEFFFDEFLTRGRALLEYCSASDDKNTIYFHLPSHFALTNKNTSKNSSVERILDFIPSGTKSPTLSIGDLGPPPPPTSEWGIQGYEPMELSEDSEMQLALKASMQDVRGAGSSSSGTGSSSGSGSASASAVEAAQARTSAAEEKKGKKGKGLSKSEKDLERIEKEKKASEKHRQEREKKAKEKEQKEKLPKLRIETEEEKEQKRQKAQEAKEKQEQLEKELKQRLDALKNKVKDFVASRTDYQLEIAKNVTGQYDENSVVVSETKFHKPLFPILTLADKGQQDVPDDDFESLVNSYRNMLLEFYMKNPDNPLAQRLCTFRSDIKIHSYPSLVKEDIPGLKTFSQALDDVFSENKETKEKNVFYRHLNGESEDDIDFIPILVGSHTSSDQKLPKLTETQARSILENKLNREITDADILSLQLEYIKKEIARRLNTEIESSGGGQKVTTDIISDEEALEELQGRSEIPVAVSGHWAILALYKWDTIYWDPLRPMTTLKGDMGNKEDVQNDWKRTVTRFFDEKKLLVGENKEALDQLDEQRNKCKILFLDKHLQIDGWECGIWWTWFVTQCYEKMILDLLQSEGYEFKMDSESILKIGTIENIDEFKQITPGVLFQFPNKEGQPEHTFFSNLLVWKKRTPHSQPPEIHKAYFDDYGKMIRRLQAIFYGVKPYVAPKI